VCQQDNSKNIKCIEYTRAVRLTEKFGSFGTFFSTEKLYAKEPVVSVLISRLTPAKRPPDCRLKYLKNNKIVHK
jgi:hypothetical protein